MVASTPFFRTCASNPCLTGAVLSRSRPTSLITSCAASIIWIEDNSRRSDGLVRVGSRRAHSFSSLQLAPRISTGDRIITRCCCGRSNSTVVEILCDGGGDGVGEGNCEQAHIVGLDDQPWSTLLVDGVKGWVLGLAMAGTLMIFLTTGVEAAPSTGRTSPRTVSSYDPVSQEEREASDAFARRVTEALALLDKARTAQASHNFLEALRCYSLITERSGDLALAEYARVGRAVTLYEVGDRAEAIAELEGMSLSMKGYPEVHAALAAAMYTDKHAPGVAEQQFTFATLLDRRYADPAWVQSAKHWPPSLIVSLQRFIALN